MKTVIKLASVGSRNFVNRFVVYRMLDILYSFYNIECLVSGGKDGADTISVNYAKYHRYQYTEIIPDWVNFGPDAGRYANSFILDNSDLIVAFWDCKTSDIADIIDKAIQQNKPYIVVQPIETISKGISKFSDIDIICRIHGELRYNFYRKVHTVDVETQTLTFHSEESIKYEHLCLIHYNQH